MKFLPTAIKVISRSLGHKSHMVSISYVYIHVQIHSCISSLYATYRYMYLCFIYEYVYVDIERMGERIIELLLECIIFLSS